MKIDKNTEVTTKIQSISLNNFKVANITKEQRQFLNNEKFAFEFNIRAKSELTTKEFTVYSTISIFSNDSKTLYLGEIETTGVFELQNLDEITEKHHGMPNAVIAMFIGILLSTTRGMLLIKSQGTLIDGALIPMINTSAFFPTSTPEKCK
ncbi:MAG: hypothetical protein WAQ28_18565 [Bacteroidia bacterium]|jgi:preprotein translocase subunit SecB